METELTAAGATPALNLEAGRSATWSVSTDAGFTGEATLQIYSGTGGGIDLRRVVPGEVGTVDGPGAFRLSVKSIDAEQDITFTITENVVDAGPVFTDEDKAKLGALNVAEAVAEATDETDIVDQFNSLLASLQAAGLMAPTPEEE